MRAPGVDLVEVTVPQLIDELPPPPACARGELTEVDATRLSFSTAEADALLNGSNVSAGAHDCVPSDAALAVRRSNAARRVLVTSRPEARGSPLDPPEEASHARCAITRFRVARRDADPGQDEG